MGGCELENIGDAAKTFECLVLVRANRFVAQVAARGDDGKPSSAISK